MVDWGQKKLSHFVDKPLCRSSRPFHGKQLPAIVYLFRILYRPGYISHALLYKRKRPCLLVISKIELESLICRVLVVQRGDVPMPLIKIPYQLYSLSTITNSDNSYYCLQVSVCIPVVCGTSVVSEDPETLYKEADM